jgi:hypothetical protein
MSVGVMKDYKLKLGSYASRIHWVDRGTGTPKDRDEVNDAFSDFGALYVCFIMNQGSES